MAKQYKYQKSFTFDGKRYNVKADTEEELYTKIANKKRDLELNMVTTNGSMLVKDWANKAIDVYKRNQKDVTRDSYEYKCRHYVLDHIGTMQIKRVKPIDCQRVLNLMEGKSKTAVNDTYQILNFIFSTAVKNKLILENPADNLVMPKYKSNSRRAITDEERQHLMKVAEADSRFNLFLLMLYCGCRPSEAMEAKGFDIMTMEDNHYLHIRGTKTENASRMVPLPDFLYEKFKDLPPMSPLCSNEAGRKHNRTSYRRLCHRLYREMNISMGCRVYRNELIPPYPLADDFVPYCLRHTYATDLCKAGIDVRVGMKLMGHADISTLANIYTHVDKSGIIDAAEKLKGYTQGYTP